MKSIVYGGTDSITATTGSFKGVSLTTILTNGTANTAFTGDVVDMTNANLRVIWSDGKKERVICNDNLRNLLATSQIESPAFEYVIDQSKIISTLAAGIGVKATAIRPLVFDFGEVVTVPRGGSLYVEVSVSNSYYTSQCEAATSKLQFDTMEGIGNMTVIPEFRSKIINAAVTNPSENLGDNVTKLVVVNYDKTSFLTADNVFNTLMVTSDKVKINDTFSDLVGRNEEQFSSQADAQIRKQCWLLHNSGVELDNVVVDGVTNSSNVTASKNFILWKTYFTDTAIVSQAVARKEKHENKALVKLGIRTLK